ncbi:hypothetical protein VITFI_CDS0550 [Vitreoscilla filiformis]|uniref:Uncharacterized protein n=1 Tax=Vitreoscilla filiformis TaxID=63 RepID=A0A221KBH3_VITFI|nr:hypothetical protein VITFI_CDS0550 [Vitreoscilla filiformis]
MKTPYSPPTSAPDGTKKKALTTAPTVEQGQLTGNEWAITDQQAAPTAAESGGFVFDSATGGIVATKAGTCKQKMLRSPGPRRALVALLTGADTSPTA